jgi:hypothetical protein
MQNEGDASFSWTEFPRWVEENPTVFVKNSLGWGGLVNKSCNGLGSVE